jgi:hypothetical protein
MGDILSQGVWSDPVRVKARTDTKANLCFHSTFAKT